jgi:hypothetical protein
MKPLLIINREQVEDVPFISMVLFDATGQQCGSVQLPFNDKITFIIRIDDLLHDNEIDDCQFWTSSTDIYSLLRANLYDNVLIKDVKETSITKSVLEDQRDVIMELYGIKTKEIKGKPILPPLPKWRAILSKWIRKLLLKIEEPNKYDKI